MPQNQYVPFATATGANVLSAADFLALQTRQQGFQAGDASSSQFNTVWRQSSVWASALGEFVAENGGVDALDDGNVSSLLTGLRLGISGLSSTASYLVDTSTTPGLLTAARTPRLQNYQAGLALQIRLAQPIPGPTNINVDGLGPVPIVRAGGGQLAVGDFLVGDILPLIFDGSKFIVLADINQAVIDAPITKTVHGTNPDFADLNVANAWLARRRITQSGFVTLSVAAGVNATRIIYSTDINIEHRDGARIAIVGQPLSNAIPAPSALTYTGTRATDTAAALATLRGVYSTEIQLTGGKRFNVTGNIANIQDILITNDGISGGDSLQLRFGQHTLTRIASVGAANRGIVTVQSYTFIIGICHMIGCGVGYSAEVSGLAAVQAGAVLSGMFCSNIGLNAAGGSIACADVALAQLYARGCGSVGINVQSSGASVVASTISIARDCVQAGYSVVNNGAMAAMGCSGSGSPIIFQAGQGGYIDASNGLGNATSGSATNVAFRAFIGGLINRYGTTATGTNGVASPAAGTIATDGAAVY